MPTNSVRENQPVEWLVPAAIVPARVLGGLGLVLTLMPGGKVPVFGLLKRGGKVYAKIVPDASARAGVKRPNVRRILVDKC